MRTIYLESDEFAYECPYCGVSIVNHATDKMEDDYEYCSVCGEEFKIEVCQF